MVKRYSSRNPKPTRRSAKRRKNGNSALLIGVILAVVLVAAVWIWQSDSEGPSSPGERRPAQISEPTPGRDGPRSQEIHAERVVPKVEDIGKTASEAMASFRSDPPNDEEGFRRVVGELRALLARAKVPQHQELLRGHLADVYRAFIAGPGPDNEEARTFLGYRAFDHELPEEISYRGHAFLRAVEWATEKRWFGPQESAEWEAVRQAWASSKKHARLLTSDTGFELGDRMASALGMDKALATRHLTTRWKSPYLICHVAREPTHPYAALVLDDAAERRKQLVVLERRAESVAALLDRQANMFGQLYAEYMRRYAKLFGLKHLMEPWGGRPDIPKGARSFREGAPLTVLYFEDTKTFKEVESLGEKRASDVSGYYSPWKGRLCLHGPASEPGPGSNLRLGTIQLENWFARQRNMWIPPRSNGGFFHTGFPAYFGFAEERQDGTLQFGQLNRTWIESMQTQARVLEAEGGRYRLFPLKALAGFATPKDAIAHATTSWQLSPEAGRDLYLEQSWALIYFLATAEDESRRAGILRYHDLVMQGKTDIATFAGAFGLDTSADWQRLEKAFHGYVENKLIKTKPR